MKTSKVKSVQGNGSFEGKYGLLYKFEYEMENGDVGEANHKSPEGIKKVGEEVTYELKSTDYGDKIKFVQPEGGSYKKTGNNASFALSYAKDVHIARMAHTTENVHSGDLFLLADKMYEWLNKKG